MQIVALPVTGNTSIMFTSDDLFLYTWILSEGFHAAEYYGSIQTFEAEGFPSDKGVTSDKEHGNIHRD